MIVSLVLLLGVTVAAPVLGRRWGRNAGYPIAAVFLLAAGSIAAQIPRVVGGESLTAAWEWIPALGVSFALRLDGLGLLFALLVLGVGALVMAYSARYLEPDAPAARLYTLLSAFATAMLGLVLAADVLTLFLCWELTTICSFFLIGGSGTTGAKPAMRALLITGGGGLALFAALAFLTVGAGTTDLSRVLADPELLHGSGFSVVVEVLVILAAFTKSAQLPFHFWLPGAMVALTPVSAYLHAATMVKAGIYLLLRFSPLYGDQPVWTYVLLTVGLATAVYGALLALRQHDLKALLAYSTMSQLGLLVAATGVGTPAALGAVATHTFAHALFKATLFMLVGIIDREAGSRDIRELSGLRHAMPVTATLTGVAALSMAGVPPLLGFVSKETLFEAFLAAPGRTGGPEWMGIVAAATAVLAASLTFAYAARIVAGAFFGPLRQGDLYEPSKAFVAPTVVPALASVALGLGVSVLTPLANRITTDVAPRGQDTLYYIELWHGFTPALGLSAVTLGLGTVLYLARDPVERWLQRWHIPVTGSDVFDALYTTTLRAGAAVGRPSQTSSIAGQLSPILVTVLVLAAVGALARPELTRPLATVRTEDWFVVALLAPAALALAVVRSRFAAVSLLGLVGFLVAVWFLLAGAPDLVLTTLVVEILTVLVAVLVLRRLPGTFTPTRRGRRIGAAVLAAGVGLAAAGATYALTGRREISTAGEYYLTEAREQTGGTNVVNSILVDFRGLDTLGEITVLAAAAVGVGVLLKPAPQEIIDRIPPEPLLVRQAQRVISPLIIVLAVYLLLRGHYEPGGGFVAALVAGVAVALHYLAYGPAGMGRLRRTVPWLLGGGIGVAVLVGLGGLVLGGSFLTGGELDVPVPVLGSVKLTAALIFDLGVFAVVVALVIRAVDRLGVRP